MAFERCQSTAKLEQKLWGTIYLGSGFAWYGLVNRNIAVTTQWACMPEAVKRGSGKGCTASSIEHGEGPVEKNSGSGG